MNKKGFTLIELLAVIALIAIIAIIAVPNVVKLTENSKKEQYISDANNIISKVKYMYRFVDSKYESYFTSLGNDCHEIKLKDVNITFDTDPYGNTYDVNNSKVKVCKESQVKNYYIVLKSTSSGSMGIHEFVLESDLDKEVITKEN